jgi:hypothetical protein
MQPAASASPPSPSWVHLSRLAGILRDAHRLQASIGLADDGGPALQVTGEEGSAIVLAGSVHYWWSRGEGPIGPVAQAGLVAEKIAAASGRQQAPEGRHD